ncbi:MAG TPA: hypothetical protein DIC53_05230 [Synergistaceae bacterium]|nr:hypothetical protein [Synergistaceae bacterium]
MTDSERTAQGCGKLLLAIVRRERGDQVVEITRHAGARGGTVALGRGESDNPLMEFLSIGDFEEDVVLTLTSDDQAPAIMAALRAYEDKTGKHKTGVVMQLDVSHVLHHTTGVARCGATERSEPMKRKTDKVLISVIVNRGFADDVMAEARKAGARGGTIMNARGTASEKDVRFLGFPLFPEKEILLILADRDKQDAVLEAVRSSECISQPGGGIAFTMAVEDSFLLGEKLK